MPFPINPTHKLLLEDGTSYLLLEDGTSKVILDKAIALDDPLDAATVADTTPTLTFAGTAVTIAQKRFYFHIETTLQGAPTAPTGSLTVSELLPDQLDSAGQIAGHQSTNSGAAASLLNKPTAKDVTEVAGEAPVTNPPAVAHRFGWFSDQKYTGNFASGSWRFQWREDDNNAGLAGHAVLNAYAGTTRDFANMRFLGQLHGNKDWWLAGTNAVDFWDSNPVGSFALNGEYLFFQLWCHETAGFSGGQTLTFNTEGRDLTDATRSHILTPDFTNTAPSDNNLTYEVEVDTVNTFDSISGLPLLDKTSDINEGFFDDITNLGDDKLLLEDNTSFLLQEDNSSKIIINRSYPSGNYVSYTVQAANALSNLTYYWRARERPTAGTFGEWSEIRSFTVAGGATGIKVWNGTTWDYKPATVWDGGAWVVRPIKVWDGGAWVVKG